MSHPRTTPFPGPPAWAHSAQTSPQGANLLGRGLANRSPSGALAGWPRAGKASVLLSSDASCAAWNPRHRERPLQPPGAGPNPGLLPRKGPSRHPHHLLLSHHHSTPGTWLPTSWLWAPNKLSGGRQRVPSPSPLPPGHCQARGSTQRSDAHEHPTHPAAFIQRRLGTTWPVS